jgi:hypothetical protein
MMQVMRDIGGIEIPESLAKLVDEDGTRAGDGAKAEGNGRAAESKRPPEARDELTAAAIPAAESAKPQA